jgi:hypothetical protein
MSGINSMRTTYGRCVLYSTCTGPSNLFFGNVSVLEENIACLSSKHRKQQKTCEEEGLTLFEVKTNIYLHDIKNAAFNNIILHIFKG